MLTESVCVQSLLHVSLSVWETPLGFHWNTDIIIAAGGYSLCMFVCLSVCVCAWDVMHVRMCILVYMYAFTRSWEGTYCLSQPCCVHGNRQGNLNLRGLLTCCSPQPSTDCPRQKIGRVGVQITLCKRRERCICFLLCVCSVCSVTGVCVVSNVFLWFGPLWVRALWRTL